MIKPRRLMVLLAAMTMAVVSGCGGGLTDELSDAAPGSVSGAVVTPQTGAPGELVGAPVPFNGYQAVYAGSADAVAVRYRSTSGIDGSPTVVSGVVFRPKGLPPEGGWRVISVGHSTSGWNSDCGPSLYPDLLGSLPTVLSGVERGYVVAMTDYAGLGMPGPHPYLEPKTAAYNMIDAVRAARALVPDTSAQWGAFGYSQGGQAAWAASEESDSYGGELDLVGAVALAPPANVVGLVDGMVDGTLTDDQTEMLPMVLRGAQAAKPDLQIEDYLSGGMAAQEDAFLSCIGFQNSLKQRVIAEGSPEDVRPVTPQAAEVLRAWLTTAALPSRRSDVPLYVAYGDRDELVLPAWTAAAVREACANGQAVYEVVRVGEGHQNLDASGPAVEWLLNRFAGLPAPDTCH